MSNLGPVWEDDEDYSPARMNAKGIHRDTGTNLVALATTKQLGAVCPTDTSAGLIKNVTYILDYNTSFNRIGFIPIFGKHLHDTDTSEAGGSLFNIEHANSGNVIRFDFTITTAPWVSAGTNGTFAVQVDGENTDGGAYLQLDTLTTTNNDVTATLRGPAISLADKAMFQLKGRITANTNLLVRTGMGVDRVQDAQSTSRRQFGLEGCDGHGTNWVVINANGSASSLTVTATTSPLNPSPSRAYKVVHTPATEVRFYENGVSNAVSTTNVASDSFIFQPNFFRAGIDLPSGTTAKQFKFWNVSIIGKPAEFT